MPAPPAPQPTLFVPHGAPTFALRSGAAGAALRGVTARLARPRAVVVVSAHWSTTAPTVGVASRLETIHDYRGFPDELYSIGYPATGCPEAAMQVLDHMATAGFASTADATRGLDHGAWIPLRLMFPDADVPVIPLSIQGQLGPAHHLAVGRALAPLTTQGFLLIGSGSLTHNLRDSQLAHRLGDQAPAYVREFADWVWQQLVAGDLPALLDYRQQAPAAERAHPTDEHLLPLYVALGAAGDPARVERLHVGIDDHAIAMDAFAFPPGERA